MISCICSSLCLTQRSFLWHWPISGDHFGFQKWWDVVFLVRFIFSYFVFEWSITWFFILVLDFALGFHVHCLPFAHWHMVTQWNKTYKKKGEKDKILNDFCFCLLLCWLLSAHRHYYCQIVWKIKLSRHTWHAAKFMDGTCPVKPGAAHWPWRIQQDHEQRHGFVFFSSSRLRQANN